MQHIFSVSPQITIGIKTNLDCISYRIIQNDACLDLNSISNQDLGF